MQFVVVHILEWFAEIQVDLHSWNVFSCAARANQIGVMEYFLKINLPWTFPGTGVAAADNGNMASLRWLFAHGYPMHADICWAAAASDELATLQWLREQGCPWDRRVLESARLYYHTEVETWALDHECPEE